MTNESFKKNMKNTEGTIGAIFIIYLASSPLMCNFFNVLNLSNLSSISIGDMFINSFFIKKQWLAPAIIGMYFASSCIVILYSILLKKYRNRIEHYFRIFVQICSLLTWTVFISSTSNKTQNLGEMYKMDIVIALMIQGFLISIGKLPAFSIFMGPSGACAEYVKIFDNPFVLNLNTVSRTIFTVMLAIPLTYKLRDIPQEHFYELIQTANSFELFAFIHVILISLIISFHKVPYYTNITLSFIIQSLLLMTCVNFNAACAWCLVL